MISSLTGVLTEKTPTEILIMVNGVGYAVSIPLSTFERLGSVNDTVTVFTHLHVREDALQLYGFATTEEREMFKLLISVSGIGPKVAQSILSGSSVADLREFLFSGNTSALLSIPGIGRKTADRLIVELREKIAKTHTPVEGSISPAGVRFEALQALVQLGLSRTAAEQALREALKNAESRDESVEQLIKRALRSGAKK